MNVEVSSSGARHTRTSQLCGLVAGAVDALLLTACQSDDEASEPAPTSTLATPVPSLDSYCQVQQLRQMIAAGELKRSQLPSFADPTEVRGTPSRVTCRPGPTRAGAPGRCRVLDFRDPPRSSLTGAQYTQQLLRSLHAKSLLQDAASTG